MTAPVVPAPVADAEFTQAFLRRAVTQTRVENALASLASREIRVGPYRAGPASMSASGTLGTARVRATASAEVGYEVTVPATLDLAIKIVHGSRLRCDVEIDLVLCPRPAQSLLLVIDVAPVQPDAVRIGAQGRGLGVAFEGPVAVFADEIRKQVARQVSTNIESGGLRSSRSFDIAARIAGEAAAPTPESWEWMDDEQFGRLFVGHAVTEARLQTAFAGLAGQRVEIGPLRAGPRGVATVSATGEVGTPTVRATGEVGAPTVRSAGASFDVTLPIAFELSVDLKRDNRFHVDVDVLLVARPRTAADLHLVIDIADIDPDAVSVRMSAKDRLAGLIGRAGKLEQQIRHHVAASVNKRIAASGSRVIDIGARIDDLDSRGSLPGSLPGSPLESRPRPRPHR